MIPTLSNHNPGRSLLLLAGILSSVSTVARADYAAEILSENPLAYYRFDDGVTTDDLDTTVATNLGSLGAAGNGSFTGIYSRGTAGVITGDNAIAFTQLTTAAIDYRGSVNIPNNAALNPSEAGTNPFTLECWVKPNTNTSPLLSPVNSMSFSPGRAGYLIYQNGATWQLRLGNNASTTASILNGGTVTPGVWQHLVATYTGGASGTMRLFVNGVDVSPGEPPTGVAVASYQANTNAEFRIGATTAPNRTFDGSVDEVAFYNTLLSPARIAARYAEATANPAGYSSHVLADSPVGYWRLNEAPFVPRPRPLAVNAGSLGAPANGEYYAGSKNTSSGPSAANGFGGMGASNSALGALTGNGYVGTNLPLLNNRPAFTVAGWVKRGANKSTRGGYFGQNDLLEFGDAGGGASIEAWINATGGNIVQPYTFADDAWGFIVLTGDGTNNRLFLNGVEVGSRAATVSNYGASGFNFNIGGGGIFNGSGDFFLGEIDEVAVFDKAVTAARVRSLYHAALGNVAPTEVGVVASTGLVSEGQTYTLTADHDGSPAFTYEWFVDGNPIPASNTKTLTIASAAAHVPANSPFIYTVKVTNDYGNLTSPSGAAVTVIPGLVWEGADATNPTFWDLATTANWRPVTGGAATTFADGVSAVFSDAAVGTTVDVRTTVTPQSLLFSNATKTITVGGSGTISGGTGLTKTGGGTAVVTNANTFSGPVVVNGGTLTLGDGSINAIPESNVVTVSAGTLRYNGPTAGSFLNPTTVAPGATLVIDGAGTFSVDGFDSITGGGSEVFSRSGSVYVNRVNQAGTISITAGDVSFDGSQNANRAAALAAVTVESGAAMTVRGVNALPTGVNSVNVTLNGGLLNVISGESPAIPGGQSHAHLGNLTLNGGTIQLGYAGGGSTYNGESFQLNGDVTVTGTTPSQITVDGADTANSGISTFNTRTFTVADVTGDAAPDLVVSAELQNRDAGPGTSSLTKTGPGTLLLDGGLVHPVSGAITVAQGTLLGTGSVAGALTVAAGAVVSPGNSIGNFASGPLALSGSVVIDINGASADQMNIVGGIALNPGSSIAVNAIAPTAPLYVIATYSGLVTGGIPNVTGVPAGYTVDLFSTPGQVRLVSNYYTWAASKGLTGSNNAPGQDADGDGSSNLLEFITGTNPGAFDVGIASAKVQDVAGSPALTLTVLVRTGATFAAGPGNAMQASVEGVTCRVEATGDLTNWTHTVLKVTPAITAGLPPAPSGYVYHTFRAAGPYSSTSRDLIRMTVAQP